MPKQAFTLVELVVIVAAVGVLGLLLAPALASARSDSRAVLCANNLRQVTMAWNMYVDQGGGLFPPNLTSDSGFRAKSWVDGVLDYNGSIDDTNTYCLTGSNACLSRYIKDPAVYKCPADQSCQYGSQGLPRNRSISMNGAIGPNDQGTTTDQGLWLPASLYKVYIKMADVIQPSPANLWLLTEEHPNSINDGSFAVEMPTSPNVGGWIDWPAKYHEKSCNFAFVDGHVVLHKWVTPSSILYMSYGPVSTYVPTFNFTDIQWVARRTSALISGAPLPF